MSIVTFWGSGEEQVGKTLAVVAVATTMAIEHNKKILVISASYKNENLKKCYWEDVTNKKQSIFIAKKGAELDNGMEGLAKITQSNKITPSSITDYTNVVFKDRLEVLLGFRRNTPTPKEEVGKIYAEVIYTANQYYDIVLVDLDNEIDDTAKQSILKKSDLVVTVANQKMSSINKVRKSTENLPANQKMLLIGRYDRSSKYTTKNIARAIGEKKELKTIPYSTLYFEASEEGTVTDLFLKLRRIEDRSDSNYFFVEQVKSATQEIMKRMQEEQENKMR